MERQFPNSGRGPRLLAARSETAKRIRLGRKPGQTVVPKTGAPPDVAAGSDVSRKRRGPRSIAEARAAAKAHLEG